MSCAVKKGRVNVLATTAALVFIMVHNEPPLLTVGGHTYKDHFLNVSQRKKKSRIMSKMTTEFYT